jgi:hypothetical protein
MSAYLTRKKKNMHYPVLCAPTFARTKVFACEGWRHKYDAIHVFSPLEFLYPDAGSASAKVVALVRDYTDAGSAEPESACKNSRGEKKGAKRVVQARRSACAALDESGL